MHVFNTFAWVQLLGKVVVIVVSQVPLLSVLNRAYLISSILKIFAQCLQKFLLPYPALPYILCPFSILHQDNNLIRMRLISDEDEKYHVMRSCSI